jgi:hypothetical protein
VVQYLKESDVVNVLSEGLCVAMFCTRVDVMQFLSEE